MPGQRGRTLLAVAVVLILGPVGCGGRIGNAGEAAAIAKVERLGGKVELDEKTPEHSVVKVYLHSTGVKDTDLVVLKEFTHLRNLFLGKTRITDAGLEHLQGLAKLQTLSLNSTPITDAGLKPLAGLNGLQTLNLQETQTTAAGVAELRRLLPSTKIAR